MFIVGLGLKSQTIYYSKSSGSLNVLGTWGTNTNGSGTSPANFTSAGVTYIITNTSLGTIGAAWTVSGLGSVVQVGDGINPLEFIIPSTQAFSGALSVSNSATLTNLNTVNPSFVNLAVGSTVNYAATGNQTILNAAYHNLLLNGSGQKALANALSTSISNSLVINTGVLFRLNIVNTVTTTLSGTVTGDGAIVGNANANLVVSGNGDAGSLTFTTTQVLNQFRIARTGGGIVSLASDLTVNSNFIHDNGSLRLTTNSLTLNGPIQFPANATSGVMRGSATSSLAIGGTGVITNSLLFEQSSVISRSLDRFVFNRTGQSLSLGNDFDILNQFTHTAGLIQLNSCSFTLGGSLVFPAALGNGYFIGSLTSSLVINGAGTITNALKLDPTNAVTQSLARFVFDYSGATLSLGTSLNCVSAFSHINGPLSLGTNSLNINGAIIFPASAANGNMIGSATSSLTIGGSGLISNALQMNTSSAAASTFNFFSLNRSGQTLTLGSALIVNTYSQSNGSLALNDNSLTLNGLITLPLAASNGVFVGSTSSTLDIGSSASLVTNPLNFSQSTAAARSLSRFTVNRSGQTLLLGSTLAILDNFVQTNGIIDLNGQSLSIGGTLTLPSGVANGYFIGSSTSSLSITGAGPVSNALRLDQSSLSGRSLATFEVDHNIGAITLDGHIDCISRFTHNNGAITLGSNSLTLLGEINFPASASNGSFTGSTSSSLVVSGSGPITNVLCMSQGATGVRTLNHFTLNRPGQIVSLGNPLRVTNFFHSNGQLAINGSSLTLTGAATFPASSANGGFIGSPTSSLGINGSASALTNELYFSQVSASARSLSRLSFNKNGQTLTLGANLEVLNNYVHTSGLMALNGKALSAGGVINFPNSTALGYIISSPGSSLSITGAGVVTNALRLDAATTSGLTLDAFTIDHTGGSVTLGTDVICSSNFSHVNGPVTLGTNSLVLNGIISLPLSAANGSLTGSTSSTLIIGGSGSISNALFMSQTSAAARTFNSFQMNRVGQTLTIGNDLITTTHLQTAGVVDLNGNLLTINGPITFPGSIATGGIMGSLNSSLTIAGTGVISNALLMVQNSSTTRSLYDLILNRSGESLTLGNAVEIRNMIRPTSGTINTGGFVTLKADGLRSAMIGVVTGAMSGNIKVESHAPGGFTGWTNLGPSGVTGLTVASWEGQFPVTCFSCPYDENSAGGFFVSIQSFNEAASGTAAYVPLSYSSVLTPGKGYWVYFGNGFFTTSNITYSVTGPVVTGNVAVPLTVSANSGYNLVSNPYAAPIDWDLLAADAANTNVSGSVYFYNPDLGQTISYAGGISNPSGYIANGVVPAGQGFYVQALSGTNVTFRETHKSTENTNANPLLRATKSNGHGTIFRLSVLGENLDYDETTIRFHPNATDTFDRVLDARKLFETPGYLGTGPVYSKYTTISTRAGSDDLSINSLSAFHNGNYHIPVLVKVMSTGKYTISPVDLDNLPEGSCVFLKDRLLNVSHDFRTGPYKCEINDTSSTVRFELEICHEKINLVSASASHAVKSSVIVYPKDGASVMVQTHYEKDLQTKVSAYTVSGQQIISEQEMNGSDAELLLDFNNYRAQIVLIKVSNTQGHTVKKVVIP